MILEAILILSGVSALGNIVNLFMKNKEMPQGSISVTEYMTKNLPVITLNNNGVTINFLIDTGSNVSHICPEAAKLIEHDCINDKKIVAMGIGGAAKGANVCTAKFKDTLGKEYTVQMLISKSLEPTVEFIKINTGVEIHGLLGTDFLQKYKCVIDFKELEIYTRK